MNGLQISGISYNVDLNSAGHEYDNWIVNGVKVAGAVVAVVATAGTAAAAGGAAAAIDTAVDVADTVTDVASITSNQKTMSRMEQFQQNYNQQSTDLETYNQNIGQQLGQNKGIIESAVGWVTDKTMGKPQRRRAISNYLNDTLMPQFKNEMQRISAAVVDAIRQSLCDEVQDTFEQMNSALDDLKRKKQQSQQEFDAKMSKLKEYKKQLLTN